MTYCENCDCKNCRTHNAKLRKIKAEVHAVHLDSRGNCPSYYEAGCNGWFWNRYQTALEAETFVDKWNKNL